MMNKNKLRYSAFTIILAVAASVYGWKTTHLDNNLGLSNSSVNAIFQDSQGYVWIGTWDGLNRYDGGGFKVYASVTNDSSTLSHPVVREICEEDSLHLWVATDGGLNRLDKNTGRFRRYYLSKQPFKHQEEQFWHCAVSPRGDVYACVNNGPIYIYNKGKDRFEVFMKQPGGRMHCRDKRLTVISEGHIRRYDLSRGTPVQTASAVLPAAVVAVFDNKGDVWIQHTGSGTVSFMQSVISGGHVFRLDDGLRKATLSLPVSGRLISLCRLPGLTLVGTDNGMHTFGADGHTHSQADTTINTLFPGSQGIVWAGTDGQGVFRHYRHDDYIRSFPVGETGFPVRAIIRHGDELLVGTKGKGLYVIKENTGGSNPVVTAHFNVGTGRTNNAVFALAADPQDGKVWVGTDGQGLSYYDGSRLRPVSFLNPEDKRKIYSVYSIVRHGAHTLFLGTSGNGILKATVRDGIITSVTEYRKMLPHDLAAGVVYSLVLDYPHLWAGTRGGGIICLNVEDNTYRIFNTKSRDRSSLVSDDIISLYLDVSRRLWIGTSQGLDMMSDIYGRSDVTDITSAAGLTNMNVHHILEDFYRNIWISTGTGLFRIDTNRDITNFNYLDGLQGNEFSDGAGLAADNGKEIYFGGTNGISRISTAKMQLNTFMPGLLLSQVTADGKEYPLTGNLRLPYGSRTVELDFSILDYINNGRCGISYYIERDRWVRQGIGNKWTYLQGSKKIILNELAPGEYTLVVRQSNYAHRWSDKPLRLSFSVSYPVWQRWWAVMIYFLFIAGMTRYVYLRKKYRLLRKHRYELERQGQQARDEIHHAKLNFFSKITNGFSNNITQIFDAVSKIEDNNGRALYSDELERITVNITRMKEQIRQIGEMRSSGEENVELTPERFDLAEMVMAVMDNHMDTILNKRLRLVIPETRENTVIVSDRTILSRALNYMLRYIFVHAQTEGEVRIGWTAVEDSRKLTLSYQGKGPEKDELDSIFNYENALDRMEVGSTDEDTYNIIGLTIGNNLIRKAGGQLQVHSSEGRTGLTLILNSLPALQKDEPRQEENTLQNIINRKDKHIAVIEDDELMGNFISHILSERYQLSFFTHDSLKDSASLMYADLIVADLMDDGSRLIANLKNMLNGKYIPIIAICNEGSREKLSDVLSMGVSTLLEKPFTRKYFSAVVEHNIQTINRMRDYSVSGEAFVNRFGGSGMNTEVRLWLQKAADILKSHYFDDTYDASRLAEDMAISRSQLYRKMKASVNSSPNEFILEYRMIQVEKMLNTTNNTVSEIINACGFHNRSYFYREFTKRFKCLPTEYRERRNRKG